MLSFLGAGSFLDLLGFFRTIAIMGRPGGGKTHLAVCLSAWLLSNGYVDGVVSNIPVAFSVPLSEEVGIKNKAILLDESWLYLSDRESVFRYGGFVRKHKNFLLLPSVYPVHRLLMRFTCERTYNLFAFGLPGWLYRWRLDRVSVREAGYFVLWRPHEAFGYYDTLAIPPDDGGIVAAMRVATGKIIPGSAADYQEKVYLKLEEDGTDDTRITDALEDVLDGLDQTDKSMGDALQKIKRIKR